jgi:hypothetical protein
MKTPCLKHGDDSLRLDGSTSIQPLKTAKKKSATIDERTANAHTINSCNRGGDCLTIGVVFVAVMRLTARYFPQQIEIS